MDVTYGLKLVAKRFVPGPTVNWVRRVRSALLWPKVVQARRIFAKSDRFPAFLPDSELPLLVSRCKLPPRYNYDPNSRAIRAQRRVKDLLRLPGAGRAAAFLELGCGDGLVSAELQRRGKTVTAIDRRLNRVDVQVSRDGITILEMDAARLQFKDDTFDFVVSYDGFEHFSDPGRVLGEAERVTSPGGHIYLSFGPLYMSPYGLHAYDSIPLPYCQHLFREETLVSFAQRQGSVAVDYHHVNGMTAGQFVSLLASIPTLQVLRYKNVLDLSHLDLIVKFPTCFRTKTELFDDLIVASLEVLLQKRSEKDPSNRCSAAIPP
jgi:SAM-dependent methyltransferase